MRPWPQHPLPPDPRRGIPTGDSHAGFTNLRFCWGSPSWVKRSCRNHPTKGRPVGLCDECRTRIHRGGPQ